MTHYKLTYLDVKGLGESIRFILSYMGKQFEDVRLPFEKVTQLRSMPEVPYGKVPFLEIDGKVIHQSTAILRYLAIEAGLSGKDAQENLNIDMIAGVYADLAAEIVRYLKAENSSEKEKIEESLLKEIIPFYMNKFESVLKEKGGYLANGKLSWADLFAVGYTESFPGLIGVDAIKEYPKFRALVERVHSLPGIAEWIEKRPKANI